MNKKWLYGAAIAAVTVISAVSVPGSASDRVASTELKNVEKDTRTLDGILKHYFPHKMDSSPKLGDYGTWYFDDIRNQYVFLMDKSDDEKAQHFIHDLKKLGDHIVIKTSNKSEEKLKAIQEEILKTFEKQAIIYSIGVDMSVQHVKVEANFTEATKNELLRKYGEEALEITLYDPGAIAKDQSRFELNDPDPVQQIGGPNDKLYWPPHGNTFLNEEETKVLDIEVYAKTGFSQYSGTLLKKYGLYTHQDGVLLPGGDLVFGINRLPEDMKTRIRLTEIEPYPSLKPVREISNKTFDKPHGMTVNFPDRRDVIYALSVELLNAAGETFDAKVFIKAFEADETNARIEADRKTYKPSDTVKIKLTNWGPTWLGYGSWFGVQQWVSGKWMWLNGGKVFTLEASSLAPGGETEVKISLQWLGLEPGQYRIVKAGLAAPFEVVAK